MTDPKLPAAKRRLARILADEDYGPKLVRLKRSDERIVLDLIYENQGRDARASINELDLARRRHNRYQGKARAYSRLQPTARTREWRAVMDDIRGHEREFWALYKSLMGRAA